MEENKGALVPVEQSKLPIIKDAASKIGIVAKYSLLTVGFGVATVASIAAMPVLAVPVLAGLAYNGQKLLNNTMYKGHKDLAFVTRKGHNNTVKIFQDWTRSDITKNIRDYSNIEKAGFMQLQAIIGLSKFEREDKKGNILTYSTVSHGITRKTFKRLTELGYIENYEEEYKKDTRLVLPRLAFGNIKALKEKIQMYNIRFNLSDKELDITDFAFQQSFPTVFGKRGLIQKRGYEIVPDGKGGLTFEIRENEPSRYNRGKNKLKEELRGKGVPSYRKQSENSKQFTTGKENTNVPIIEEDKQL